MLHKSSWFVQLQNKIKGKTWLYFLNCAALKFLPLSLSTQSYATVPWDFQCPQYSCELLIYIGSVYDFKFFPSQAFMFMFSAYAFLLIYTFLLFPSGVVSCILYIIKNNEETYGEAVLWMNTRLIFKQKILSHQSS